VEKMDELLGFAVETATEAGERLRDAYGTIERGEVEFKGWRDLVTHLDREVEKLVVDRITEAYPQDDILAEEGSARSTGASRRWILDPLDGTTNYVHRHPFYCVSLALEDREGILLGVIYAPHLDELFTAVRGGGAWLGGRRIAVSRQERLDQALLASGFAYVQEGDDHNSNLENWARLSLKSRGLRRCGSAALDLAHVADGRYDGYWELHLNPWDVAAGALLVLEAGGIVTDGRGGPDWLEGRSIVAGNPALHPVLLAEVRL